MRARAGTVALAVAIASLVIAAAALAAVGELTPAGCIDDNDTGADGCAGSADGLDGARSVAVSPDGKSVYAASNNDDAIARFDREPLDSDGDGVPDFSDGCPAEPGPASNGGCPLPADGGGGASDTAPPDTQITAGPKAKEKKGKASFSFTSTEPGSTFECKLDDGAFEACTSPHAVKVKKGKHTFSVRAKDPAGNVDASPASDDWKVKKKKKK